MSYGVIICTKCRQHAQIIEVGSSKTTRCQRCNASLNTRKLRVFYSSDDLDETISVRTQIQAQLLGDGHATIRSKDELTGTENLKKQEWQTFGNDIDEKTACFIDNRETQKKKKKKADELIISILVKNNNQMHIEDLKEEALKLDLDEEQFNVLLKKMIDAGELYSPSNDFIRVV